MTQDLKFNKNVLNAINQGRASRLYCQGSPENQNQQWEPMS